MSGSLMEIHVVNLAGCKRRNKVVVYVSKHSSRTFTKVRRHVHGALPRVYVDLNRAPVALG